MSSVKVYDYVNPLTGLPYPKNILSVNNKQAIFWSFTIRILFYMILFIIIITCLLMIPSSPLYINKDYTNLPEFRYIPSVDQLSMKYVPYSVENANNIKACSSKCLNDSQCSSFKFVDSNVPFIKKCNLYSTKFNLGNLRNMYVTETSYKKEDSSMIKPNNILRYNDKPDISYTADNETSCKNVCLNPIRNDILDIKNEFGKPINVTLNSAGNLTNKTIINIEGVGGLDFVNGKFIIDDLESVDFISGQQQVSANLKNMDNSYLFDPSFKTISGLTSTEPTGLIPEPATYTEGSGKWYQECQSINFFTGLFKNNIYTKNCNIYTNLKDTDELISNPLNYSIFHYNKI